MKVKLLVLLETIRYYGQRIVNQVLGRLCVHIFFSYFVIDCNFPAFLYVTRHFQQ